MKKALVLAGGGTKGIYQVGAIEALKEIGEDDWSIITGTSVGALNAAMLVQGDFDRMVDMYEHLQANQIVKGFVPNPEDMTITNFIKDRERFIPSLKAWIKDRGVDISPFKENMANYYVPERFFASDIDFGCITAHAKGHGGVYVTKEMMKEHGLEWLIASASAYPAFPMMNIDGIDYIDGGYFDNFPIDFALRLGAEKVIAIDLESTPAHPNFIGRENIIYIRPYTELFSFLDFDKVKMNQARRRGYLDVMKKFGILYGERYAFSPFHRPSFFDEWYRSVMMLETRVALAGNLSEQLNSHQVITDRLKNQLHVDHLHPRQYLYGMLDSLMDACSLEEIKIYTYEEARNLILASFAEALKEDYFVPSLNVVDIASYLTSLDTFGIIAKLIHCHFYPEHMTGFENVILTVAPYEYALSELAAFMMKELAQE